MMVSGSYNPRQPLPLVPCSDGAGEVLEVGPGVTKWKVGDRAAGLFFQSWMSGPPKRSKLAGSLGGPLGGMLAEQVILSEDGLAPVPAHLSMEEAACLPCAALTAWSALVTFGRVAPGETVLVQGTGGVSLFALQFAKAAGARVIVTSGLNAKLARAKQLGADELINYAETPDWDRAVKRLTGGLGVDQVIEVGGAGTMERSLRAVAVGGTVSVIGVLSGAAAPLAVTPILMGNVRLQGILVGNREGFEDMTRAMTQHQLKPIVDRVFDFAQAREAFQHLRGASHFGKVAIRVS
jgi:NADPH:quinone reductase-like Zn-dependent oxidoreductase